MAPTHRTKLLPPWLPAQTLEVGGSFPFGVGLKQRRYYQNGFVSWWTSPCQSFVREIFLGLLSVPVCSLPAGFSSAPRGRAVGGQKGTPGTLPRHSACPSAPQPLTCRPSVFPGLDAAGILVAECGLERGGLLYLDLSLSSLSWPEQSLAHVFDPLFSLSMRLKCSYFMACVSGVQFCSQLLLQTVMVVPYVSWFWMVSFHLLRGILYACLRRKFMSD